MSERKALEVDLVDLGECVGSRTESGRRTPVAHASGARLPISDGGLERSTESTRSTSDGTRSHVDVVEHQPRVSVGAFTPAPALDVADGLLGWVDVELGALVVVHGVAVRRTQCAALSLSWPVRDDRRRERRAVVRPLDDRARVEVERQVLGELRRRRIAS